MQGKAETYHSFKVGSPWALSNLVVAGNCSIGRPPRLDECEKQKIGKLSRYC